MGLPYRTKTITAFIVLLSAFLSGCSSAPKILTHHDPDIDFKQYQTFSLYDPIADKKQAYSTLIDKHIQSSLIKELERRGLKHTENGDLKVSFNISTQEKIESTTTPIMNGGSYDHSGYYNHGGLYNRGGYYGYRGLYGYTYGVSYGTETRVSQYTEGTLNIDVVDFQKKQVVWEGAAIGRLKDKIPDDIEGRIAKIVASILAEYPIRPR